MEDKTKTITNKEKALQLMDASFDYLGKVWCKGASLDNMARARELLYKAWVLLNKTDEEPKADNTKTEVKQDG